MTVNQGDVLKLGRHRVMCGDAADVRQVRRLLDGARPDILLSDPPYCSGGFQESAKAAGSVGTNCSRNARVINDQRSTRGYIRLLKAAITHADAGIVGLFTDWRMWVTLFDLTEDLGYGVRQMVVWDKMSPGMGAGWRAQHELILWGAKARNPFSREVAQGNVIQVPRTGNRYHVTEKPVGLLEALLRPVDVADLVYDPFGGSGTTLLAAERMGRTAFVMETSTAYCEVIQDRYERLTSQPIFELFGDSVEA